MEVGAYRMTRRCSTRLPKPPFLHSIWLENQPGSKQSGFEKGLEDFYQFRLDIRKPEDSAFDKALAFGAKGLLNAVPRARSLGTPR
jgi:hypothetical protein